MLTELLNNEGVIDEKIGLNSEAFIKQEFDYLQAIILHRIHIYFNMLEKDLAFKLSNVGFSSNSFIDFINEFKLNEAERIIVILALSVEISPQLLDPFLTKNTCMICLLVNLVGLKVIVEVFSLLFKPLCSC